MSFRTRLTGFFVLIVVVPMIAVGFLVFRLIGDSAHGKADARASGLATAAASIYDTETANARVDALQVAKAAASLSGARLRSEVAALASQAGLARVTVRVGSRTLVSLGGAGAIATGSATIVGGSGGSQVRVVASELTADEFVRELSGTGVQLVVRQAGQTLASTLPGGGPSSLPNQANITVAGVGYRAVTEGFPGASGAPVSVTVLSDLSSTASSVGASRLVAAVFIAGFLLLAFAFSVLASRALQGQLGRFLSAARRLGGGDFSSPVPTEGHDEFAALGEEFNSMSAQLASKLEELSQERAKLRELLHRVGQTFASNLDRPALLELALSTAVDASEASSGRLSVRSNPDEPLVENGAYGSLDGIEAQVRDAERRALASRDLGESAVDDVFVASVALGPIAPTDRAHGQITVARRGRPFDDDDREMLRSLAAQTTLALENVELHHQVQRQAVTDELTGLANHGAFQELLSAEIEQVRRYEYPVGLIMLDIDDFKSINDTFGHQQGDVVLKQVARVLRESSRDADSPARYGGEEMALILPHTDLAGAHAIAERVRTAIEALRIPRLDRQGVLRVTASLGVATSIEGNKDALISDADAALYTAKRSGKNRTASSAAETANMVGGE
ncbi:MAG TPA: diguanylate cyclase [Solirubrobacteraceae bacterium]|jgi:diguanylate cyclase (GGDEF)-like protein|nr:diguanylate cyclase [Solirubrobacteraceae bacterium]